MCNLILICVQNVRQEEKKTEWLILKPRVRLKDITVQ